MPLLVQITNDMKEAMKSKNSATLSTLRLLSSAIKYKKIEVQHELSDEEILSVIKTQLKQLKDGLDSFVKASREDLAVHARAEILVLEAYLPKQMSDEALETLVKNIISETGVSSKQDMGRVMGAAVKASSGLADGSRIKQIVERLLPIFLFVLIGSSVSREVFAAIDIIPESFSYYSQFENGIRIFRVLLLWFGILGVNMILHGGFSYMVNATRDDEQTAAWNKIATGFISALAVVLLYSVATVMIGEI